MKWLAARAAALPPRWQDVVLGLVLAAANVGAVAPYLDRLRPSTTAPALAVSYPLAVAIVLLVLQAVPLIWRRDATIVVFLATGVARNLYDQLGFGYAPLPLGPAIAYYTVMARCSTGVRWAISCVLVVGTISSQMQPGHSEPYDFFVAVLIFAAAGMAGILSRMRTAHLGETEARAARAEAERDQEALLAAARERTRIARELHDVVAHHVSLMAVQSEAAGALLPGQPAEAARSVEIIGETARQALVELRRLLGVLRGPGELPQAAPSPSLAELDGVVAQVRRAGLAVDLSVSGEAGELAPGVDLTAYRIVQEGLTNALRHSPAMRATVVIRYDPCYVMVSVTDGGAAVPRRPAGSPGPGGFGLAGIAERVASCGGTLTVGPTGAGGFAVTAKLPRL